MGLPFSALGIGGLSDILRRNVQRYKETRGVTIRDCVEHIFIISYMWIAMEHVLLWRLRLFHDNAWGMAALVSMIVIVKMCDTGAYFSGRLFGRHKMTPVLSPKKTWEGAAGGILASVLRVLVLFYGARTNAVGGQPGADGLVAVARVRSDFGYRWHDRGSRRIALETGHGLQRFQPHAARFGRRFGRHRFASIRRASPVHCYAGQVALWGGLILLG